MSDTVITVDSLSKAYKIGLKERQGRTFREAVLDTAAAPFRRLASLATGGNGHAGNQETFWALKDVSFEVKRGEVVGIIGRNGAGKSTLLKILSQITEPTSGEVRMKGRVASLLEVGTGFHPELTGRENIYLNGAILGMKRTEITRKFDEIVAFAEVEKFLDTPVKHYSSGMYVRLAFAVAAHLEPEILIVDEVLAVGDAEFQKKCLGKMQEVSKGEGRTVLFVSHNMAAIESLCSEAILLEAGAVTSRGQARPAVRRYLQLSLPPEDTVREADLGGIKVSGIRLTGEGGGTVRTLDAGQLEVALTPQKEIGALGFRIMLQTAEGAPVADLVSGRSHRGPRLAPGYPHTLRVTMRSLPLQPGDYRAEVDICDSLSFEFWRVPYALPFSVQPSLDPLKKCDRERPAGVVAVDFRVCPARPRAPAAE